MEVLLKNENVSAKLVSKGAELKSLAVNGRELMWRADPAFWGKTSPLLFPMIGTLKDGKTLINGKEYTKEMFPFDFKFTVRYTLKTDGVTVTYRVKNNSDAEMPFCIGAHPAFACDGEFSDYRLEFQKLEDAAVPNYNLETGLHEENNRREILKNDNVVHLNHEMFYTDVCYFDKLKSRSVMLLGKDGKGVRVDFPDFTSLGVWQAKDAPFLCIEPWCGSADFDDCSGVFAEKRGIVILKVGEEKAFTYSITAVGA